MRNVKCVGEDDWYAIEADNVSVADACVEGSLAEMRQLAEAILANDEFAAKRCAIAPVSVKRGGGWEIWSPRNSYRRSRLTPDEAIALAKQIQQL